MAQKTYSGSLNLTKIKHVNLKMKGQPAADGSPRMVEGIWIPLEANKLVVIDKVVEGKNERSVFMPVRVIAKDETDDKGQNGFIAKSLSTEDYKALKTDKEKDEAKEFQPILGSIKDFSNTNTAQAPTGAASGETFTPDDDVPF